MSRTTADASIEKETKLESKHGVGQRWEQLGDVDDSYDDDMQAVHFSCSQLHLERIRKPMHRIALKFI